LIAHDLLDPVTADLLSQEQFQFLSAFSLFQGRAVAHLNAFPCPIFFEMKISTTANPLSSPARRYMDAVGSNCRQLPPPLSNEHASSMHAASILND
jgi:hypothetical protein